VEKNRRQLIRRISSRQKNLGVITEKSGGFQKKGRWGQYLTKQRKYKGMDSPLRVGSPNFLSRVGRRTTKRGKRRIWESGWRTHHFPILKLDGKSCHWKLGVTRQLVSLFHERIDVDMVTNAGTQGKCTLFDWS